MTKNQKDFPCKLKTMRRLAKQQMNQIKGMGAASKYKETEFKGSKIFGNTCASINMGSEMTINVPNVSRNPLKLSSQATLGKSIKLIISNVVTDVATVNMRKIKLNKMMTNTLRE